MPRGVAQLTTVDRTSGMIRKTYSRLTDGVHTGTARLPEPGEPDDESSREAFCTRVHVFDYFENAFHRKGEPSRRKLLELHRARFAGGTPVVVDVDL